MKFLRNDCFYADIMSDSSEVTGSCLYVTVKFPDHSFQHFIVDCGIFQEPEYRKLNSELLFVPSEIDFAIVTHNHIDHTARLPFIVKKGFNAPIYTTHDTALLMPLALDDTVSILQNRAKHDKEMAIYSKSNVESTLALIKGYDYDIPIRVTDNISITFIKNGHLVGASLVLVHIEYYRCEPINILFTGDFNNKNMFFTVPPLPEWMLNIPISVVCESTYGYMDSCQIRKTLADNIENFLNNKMNSTIILPVFSLGRSQEVLKLISDMQGQGKLKGIPVYLDGKLTLKYTKLFLDGSLNSIDSAVDFLPENLTFVDKELRQELLSNQERKIIVTSSGMGSYGPAQSYIQQYLKRKDAMIHFTGYAAEGTLARKLYDTADESTVCLNGLMVIKKARVEFTNELSAHAKADELINFLKNFTHLNLVLITHGSSEAKSIFSNKVLREVDTSNIGILSREYFFRINSMGMVKALNTHFI